VPSRALMHLGEIRELGTPTELRERLGARRLEVHTDNLGRAEDILMEATGKGEIIDVQRFGDRLDVIAPNPERGREVIESTLRAAGLQSDIYREDQPPSKMSSSQLCAPPGRR